MAFTSSKGERTQFTTGGDNVAGWDSGSWTWQLPDPAWDFISDYFNISSTTELGASIIDCKFRKETDDTFDVEITKDLTINIPMNRFVSELTGDGVCGTYASGGGGNGTGGSVDLFGATWGSPFVRSVYVTYNIDDFTVTASNVRYTDEEDIVKI